MREVKKEADSDALAVLHLNTARTWRGGEQQVLYLASFLKDSGIRQVVVGQPGSVLEERCAEAGVPFHGKEMRSELDLLAITQIIRFVVQNRFTVIHAHTARAHTLGLLAMLLGRLEKKGVRLVVSRRVDFPIAPGLLSRMKYFSPLVVRFVAISNNIKRILIEDGISPDRISVACSGVDVDRFQSLPAPSYLRKEFSLPRKAIIFGNVAALVDHKDHRTLLHAAALLKKRLESQKGHPVWRLFIVGDGELRDDLLLLRSQLNLLDEVVFTGFRKEIPAFFALFDVFVMSSKEEGLGTAVLDAMAAGLPLVSTDGGGLPEMIIPGKGGLLSPVGDTVALADSLFRILNDGPMRKRFGMFNRRYVRRFSHIEMARRNLEIYREVIHS